jgi:hypothetical protein
LGSFRADPPSTLANHPFPGWRGNHVATAQGALLPWRTSSRMRISPESEGEVGDRSDGNGGGDSKPRRPVSVVYGLGKTQPELDFVNVDLDGDLPLFVDPFALSQRPDPWSKRTHSTLVGFFQNVVDDIRAGRTDSARRLLGNLQEPNETRLGLSRGKPEGAGIGRLQAEQLLQALSHSSAVRTGLIRQIEDCELMIEGISRDKVSDLTTNVIRRHLVEYTQQQCGLWQIPMVSAPLPACYIDESGEWLADYHNVPVVDGRPLVLIPKVIVRHSPAYDHQEYYRKFVLGFLRAEHLSANSSLVHSLRNGQRRVYQKDLKREYPCSKDFLSRFSKDHPGVLENYRQTLEALEKTGRTPTVSREEQAVLAEALAAALKAIPPGAESATEYHRLMTGVLELLFFPTLLNPTVEKEIHDGRKRLDIIMENGATSGVLYRLHNVRHLPCPYVAIECKNYSKDVSNPELDQLAGRFSPVRGKLGFLCFRAVDDYPTLIARCRDTFREDRGLIIPLNDDTVVRLLSALESRPI